MFKITVEERNWNDIKQEQAVEIILLGVMDDHVNIQQAYSPLSITESR